jgi:hypothetical protein
MSEDVKFQVKYLAPLTGKIRPRKFAVYDLETNTDLDKVHLVGFKDENHYRYFEADSSTPEESKLCRPEDKGSAVDKFMVWLLGRDKYSSKRGSVWIYAHNAGNFDVLYLIRWLYAHRERYSYNTIPLQSSVLCMEVTDKAYPSRKWMFFDSLKLMNAALEKLGKAFGLGGKVQPYKDTPAEKKKFYDTLHVNPIRYDYLKTDCTLLYACLEKFYTLIYSNGGDIGFTGPGTAMASFRRTDLKELVPINRHYERCEDAGCEGCLHKFVRDGYYGGRVEVYRERYYGGEDCKLFDINSMYAAMMLMPVPVELAIDTDKPIDFECYSQHWQGFVDATVEIPEDCYLPPLPLRKNDKLLFPVGRYRGVWTSLELQQLPLVGGRIVHIHKSTWFRGKEIFSDFVNRWYKHRDKDAPGYTESMDHIAKLLLVSLYGKFGMTEERERLWFFPTNYEMDRHELEPIADVIMGAYTEKVRITPTYVIPHIAAWITAAARIHLWKMSHSIVREGYKIYYSDTDSLVTNAPLASSTKIGELKIVCKVKTARFAAPKLYYIEKEDGTFDIKAKGFSGFGSGCVSMQDFINLVDYRQKVKVSHMMKLKEGLGDILNWPRLKTVEKQIHHLDEKREHLADGNTKPLVIYDYDGRTLK